MNKKIKIIILSLSLAICANSFTPSAKAYVAWPDIGGAFFGSMLNEMWIQIRAASMGALKKAAVDTITETVNNLVAGTTQAGSLFISDWSDYLFSSPASNASSYMNDFFTITTRGKTNGNYSSMCGTNYSNYRSERAKNVNLEIDLTSLQDDFEEWACSPVEMFSGGTWDAYKAFMQPNNNPISYALLTESVWEKKWNEEAKEAEIKALAYQGFKAKEENNMVISPGSLIKDITSAANTLDNDMIANAENVGEVAGIVVGKIASNVIKQGIGNARQMVQNQINDTICSGTQSLRDQLKELTPTGTLMSGLGLGSLGTGRSTGTCNLQ